MLGGRGQSCQEWVLGPMGMGMIGPVGLFMQRGDAQ